ncbi:hypothetical protein F8M41_003542 [Gigaspora margarita]|uniref:Uncharacterized protein n=1 Tax=Gigaspora margarita TaxID=4874 RepID=A0A8H4A7N1_GIGMA|nr:hypothetical protein F8M41_003542 [Gigaspora margarita]
MSNTREIFDPEAGQEFSTYSSYDLPPSYEQTLRLRIQELEQELREIKNKILTLTEEKNYFERLSNHLQDEKQTLTIEKECFKNEKDRLEDSLRNMEQLWRLERDRNNLLKRRLN